MNRETDDRDNPRLPLDIQSEAEHRITARIDEDMSLASIEKRSQQAIAIFEARTRLLAALDKATILSTSSADWTKFKDLKGNERAMLNADGCRKVMPLHGVEIYNLRGPDGDPISEPIIVEHHEDDEVSYSAIIIGDAVSKFHIRQPDGSLSDPIVLRRELGIRAERNSDEGFTGRGVISSTNRATMLNDLKSSTRTLLDTKAVRILTATARRDVTDLKEFGLDPVRMVEGGGYGTGDERRSSQAATSESKADVESLRTAMVGYCGGDQAKALKLMQELSAFDGEGGRKVTAKSWDHLATRPKWLAGVKKDFDARLRKEQGGGQ
ncbi:MAG TPA: hypothetical protein VGK94_07815 [Candidatus Polarisedimenticolia bacterium]|jgi:hypothetical protein